MRRLTLYRVSGIVAFLFVTSSIADTAWGEYGFGSNLSDLRKAAEQGDADAQKSLALIYWLGDSGVPVDYAESINWYRKAAEQGYPSAEFKLGEMYRDGQGVLKSYVQAVTWFQKSAEQGNASAQWDLGVMYANGEGLPKDYVQGYMWLNLAGKTEEEAGKSRDKLSARMTPEQIAEAQKLSREWKPRK